MKTKTLRLLVLSGLILALAGCSQSAAPTAMASEEAVVLGGGGGGLTQSNGQVTEGLVVVGTGTVNAEPETANVVFGVELQGDDPAAIVEEAAGKIDQATAAAVELGVAEEGVRTTGYNLWVETVRDPDSGIPTGDVVYHIWHQVRVKLSDIDRVGDLLGGVVEAGANTISEVNFTVEDPDALMEQAREQALENAAARAQQMAEGLGLTLGSPVLVMETGGGTPVPLGLGGGGQMVEAAAPSISPGTFSVSVSVQVVYEIQ
jgi:uncharacterized protein YggE